MNKLVKGEIIKTKKEMTDKANGDAEEIKKEYKKISFDFNCICE